jgi:enoyl-CoA hydratase/carnithine racemase
MERSVVVGRRGPVALITLNRPEAMNAVNTQLRTELISAMGAASTNPAVRAVVLTGAGERAFCAGQDLAEAVEYGVDDLDAWLGQQHAMYQGIRDLDKPAVVAWNGVAAGAGFQIGLCADLRVGYPEMKLGQPEIKAGLASIVGSYLMTLHVGLSQNLQLSLTGELISGTRGYEIGLVNYLVPKEHVLEKALAVAAELAALPQTALRLTKQRFRALTQPDFDEVGRIAKACQRDAYTSGEPQRMMRSFFEARSKKAK